MPDLPKAVFLSYASQDAAAVRGIAEALRGAGVEVWFDQNELVGGDAWDAKIRKQIAECALFVPVISAATQARREGYFRLEWKLAAQRTHMIADGTPFLLPVVIDATRDADALVPPEFRAVQWTRLRQAYGGQARPGAVDAERQAPDDAGLTAFCARVQTLLAAIEDAPPATTGRTAAEVTVRREFRRELLPMLTLVAVAAAVLVPWLMRRGETKASPGIPPAVASPPPPAPEAPVLDPKSLVVLPLENLSPDPENAFFTEGMHAEIIDTLTRLSDLKVIRRASALAFKDSTAPLAEIAQKLAVANVITGSVRREGNRVRIELALRRAKDEAVLWAPPPFDRDLTDRIGIQMEIATEVGRVLRLRETKGTATLAQGQTKDPRAFDLYVKGFKLFYSVAPLGRGRALLDECITLFGEAVRIDPQFTYAASYLSAAHTAALSIPASFDNLKEHEIEAKRWAEIAAQQIPGGPGDGSLAYYHLTTGDMAKGLALAESAFRAMPNDSAAHTMMGYALRAHGRMRDALPLLRSSVALDPLQISARGDLIAALVRLREVSEVDAVIRECRNVFGPRVPANFFSMALFQTKGELPAALEGLSPIEEIDFRMLRREFAEAVSTVDRTLGGSGGSRGERFELLRRQCDALRRLGRESDARSASDVMTAIASEFESEAHPSRHYIRALSDSRAGHAASALQYMRQHTHARTVAGEQHLRWRAEMQYAALLAYVGQTPECVAQVGQLLREPSGLTVPMLKVDPAWDNVRDDVAFKALLADPKNSAPL